MVTAHAKGPWRSPSSYANAFRGSSLPSSARSVYEKTESTVSVGDAVVGLSGTAAGEEVSAVVAPNLGHRQESQGPYKTGHTCEGCLAAHYESIAYGESTLYRHPP